MLNKNIKIYLILIIQIIGLNDFVLCNKEDDYIWTCENGQVIQFDKRCDGIIHCDDASDETLKSCQHIQCPSFSFKCKYGACISKRWICDGKHDCADGSDETARECEAKIDEELLLSFSGDHCRDVGLSKCADGSCVNPVDFCDGKVDCLDGSDEREGVCRTFSCPSYAFRCKYGACISSKLKCNGVSNCLDGSDEDTLMCLTTKPNSEMEKEQKKFKSCVIPMNLTSMMFENFITKQVYTVGSAVDGDRTIVKFTCRNNETLQGCRTSTCVDGDWISPFPNCKANDVCDDVEVDSISYKATCEHNGQKVDCAGPLSRGTKIDMSCNLGYKGEGRFKSITCNEMGQWSGSALKCRPICGRAMAQGPDIKMPWVVSIFKQQLNGSYVYQCSGYILSEQLIIAAPSCLERRTYSRANKDDKTYQVVLGSYKETYSSPPDYNGYTYFNVEDIILQRWSMASQKDRLMSLIHLDGYIQFNNSVAPICVVSQYLFEKMEYDEETEDSDEKPFFDVQAIDIRTLSTRVSEDGTNLVHFANRQIYRTLRKFIRLYRH